MNEKKQKEQRLFLKVKYEAEGKSRNMKLQVRNRTYGQLAVKIAAGFGLDGERCYHLYYVDQEGDRIVVASQEDFDVFLKSAQLLILTLQPTNQENLYFMREVMTRKEQEAIAGKQEQLKALQQWSIQRQQYQKRIADLQRANQVQFKRIQQLQQYKKSQSSQIPSAFIKIQQSKNQLLDDIGQFKKRIEQEMRVQVERRLQSFFEGLKGKRRSGFVHKNIRCSGKNCKSKGQIVGVRYFCSFCEDFNLCEDCECLGDYQHDARHSLVKMYSGEQMVPYSSNSSIKREQKRKQSKVSESSMKKLVSELMQLLDISSVQAEQHIRQNPNCNMNDLVQLYFAHKSGR